MCSIKSTGLVFESSQRFDISSEVGLLIETNVLGQLQEWMVRGWVVDCTEAQDESDEMYHVTIYFSGLPKGMSQILLLSQAELLPRTGATALFGLN